MKAKFVILIILFASNVKGQDFYNYSIVGEYITDLYNNDVDTILAYEEGHVGGRTYFAFRVHDSCHVNNLPTYSYILWKKGGKDFISKVAKNDGCYDYKVAETELDSLWVMYFENKEQLHNTRLLPTKYVQKSDTTTFDIDHYPYSKIWIAESQDTLEIEISKYQIQKVIRGEYLNLSYTYNRNSIQVKFRNLIHRQIAYIETNEIIKKSRKTAYNTR